MAKSPSPAQGRASRQFECGIHNVSYEAARAGCPLCELERENARLRGAMKDVHNQLKILTEQNLALKVQVDIATAIREAALVLSDDDLAFLKGVLYEWRDQKSVALKTTHGPRKKKREIPAPNGFIAMPREGDPYGHLCSSIGGLAIAGYLDEAINTVGPANAMVLLVRGMAAHLPGAMK